ncbi:uncharacterized protein KY384_007383 [Bacidia gigantensis]|uniref:uncharacterized protein n=1 Tax=Bacidia gigantensis TaxID=2732470 RepID=UPI001D047FC1|nr:uncharacterized protein KY384_007383 [Bacidia gigantensis]KAG8528465.1 hypothetical protein KY384_007383 [Bacidia gigantensis]
MASAKHPEAAIEERKRDSSSQGSTPTATAGQDLDAAYWFVQRSGNHKDEEATPNELRALRRKIDWRIVPIMFLCYTMQFIDKVSLNYAAVMGLNKNLKLKPNEFSNAATWFFTAYLIAEVPNAIVLQKVPVAKWLGANVVLWGIATACTAAAKDYGTLLAARIFLGIFEAAIAPSLMLISSQWYTKSEAAPRFSIWYMGLGFGQIIGGVVSYGFQQVKGSSFQGWKIMFVVLGLVTVLIGFLTLIFLPDTPMKASWLSEAEKVVLLKHVAINQTGIDQKRVNPKQIVELLLDLQLWLMTILTILISISSGVVTTYSATLIKNFGYTPPDAALLNMPSGIVSIISTLVVGFGVRHTANRWAWLVLCCIPGIIGGGLLSFGKGKAPQLAGIYLVNAITATLIVIYQWTASNVAGHTKRVIAVALISGSFSVGNIIGPQTFQAKDAPKYTPAKITVLATQAAGAVMSFVLFSYYVWANKRRSATPVETVVEGEHMEQLYADQTDKENKTFRTKSDSGTMRRSLVSDAAPPKDAEVFYRAGFRSILSTFVPVDIMATVLSNGTSSAVKPHVLIIGAGITGLVLAQSLKKNDIPFTIFERDPSVSFRGRGWGLTIHWSLDTFISLLPQHLVDRLHSVYVDPDASAKGENGNFLFFDLQNGEARWKVPPANRIRVSRERLRALLLDGLDVQWSKSLTSISTDDSPHEVTAHFSDSTSAIGTLLVGADGIHSRVRPALITLSHQPSSLGKNTSLPVRLLGVTITYPPPLALKLRALDPFFFQGGDPATDTFLYFSFLDTPSSYKLREGQETGGYECQIIISWPYRPGWHGQDRPSEIPANVEDRVRFMKDVTKEWAEPFRGMVQAIPEQGADVKAIKLEDWVPKKGVWGTLGGRATMIGDAAHAMTMFRGEAANHGIADIAVLVQHLLPILHDTQESPNRQPSLLNAINAYESEMMKRTGPAVLTSRRACMDAHDYARINDQSPLVSKRVMITEDDT